jgi:hypothetical protein
MYPPMMNIQRSPTKMTLKKSTMRTSTVVNGIGRGAEFGPNTCSHFDFYIKNAFELIEYLILEVVMDMPERVAMYDLLWDTSKRVAVTIVQ